jgi:hypothetical protein
MNKYIQAWLGAILFALAQAAMAQAPAIQDKSAAAPVALPTIPVPTAPIEPVLPPAIPADIDHAALKPGEFLWLPEIAPSGPVVIVVSIPEQLAYVYRNGIRIAVSTVSTGKKGHETPTGVFTILQKHKDHKSDLYNSAPMPYMQRLTWDGVALHAGALPGYPASHGCVRLPMEFAKKLFDVTTFGITVIVANDSSTTETTHPGVFEPAPADPAVAGKPEPRLNWYEQYRWQPTRSPEGPLTIVVSGADRRVLVIRNGVEIGRARFELRGKQALGTSAYVLLEGARSEPSLVVPSRPALNWLQIDLPGYASHAGGKGVLDPITAQRISLPAKFAAAVYDAIGPGTTLLVTDAAVLPRTTGKALTVLTTGVPADEEAPPPE